MFDKLLTNPPSIPQSNQPNIDGTVVSSPSGKAALEIKPFRNAQGKWSNVGVHIMTQLWNNETREYEDGTRFLCTPQNFVKLATWFGEFFEAHLIDKLGEESVEQLDLEHALEAYGAAYLNEMDRLNGLNGLPENAQ